MPPVNKSALVHNRALALKFRRLIAATEGKDALLPFACGKLTSKIAVVNLKPRSQPTTLSAALKDSVWDGKPKLGKDKPSFNLVATGYIGVREGGLLIKSKATDDRVVRILQQYFKTGFGVHLPWGNVVMDDVDDDDANLAAQMPDEQSLLENISEQAMEQQAAAAERENGMEVNIADQRPALAAGEVDADTADPAPGAGESVGDAEEDEEDEPGAPPERLAGMPPLNEALGQEVARVAQTTADYIRQKSAEMGLGKRAEVEDLFDKFSGWLTEMLEATPPEEREAKLYNASCQLLMRCCYIEAMRDVQVVKRARRRAKPPAPPAAPPDRDDEEEDDGDPGAVPLGETLLEAVDLASIDTEPLTVEALIDQMYRAALAVAGDQIFPFDLGRASPHALEKYLRGRWKETGDPAAQFEQARKLCDDVRRLFFNSEKGLAGIIEVGRSPLAPDVAMDAFIQRIGERWSSMRGEAGEELARFKAAAEARVQEEQDTSFGEADGQWELVDEFYTAQTSPDAFLATLDHLSAASGEGRIKVIGEAEQLVSERLARIGGDEVPKAMESLGVGSVWRPAAAELRQISAMLATLRTRS